MDSSTSENEESGKDRGHIRQTSSSSTDLDESTNSIVNMNPCASTFAPKPSYADKLKASLPKQRQHAKETRSTNTQSERGGSSSKGRGVTRDESKQVGFSVHHDREPEPSSISERPSRMRESSGEIHNGHSGQPPKPFKWPPPPPGFGLIPEPVVANPHLQHLHPRHMSSPPGVLPIPNHAHQDEDTMTNPPAAYRDVESGSPAGSDQEGLPQLENRPTRLPFPPFGSAYDNFVFPMPHYPYALPPLVPPPPYHDAIPFWFHSRPGSTHEGQLPFGLPPAPYPYSPISTPVPFHHQFAHGHPQPIVPPTGPFMYGPHPYMPFPLHMHMHGRVPQYPPNRPEPAPDRCSRSSSRRDRKRSRRAQVEIGDSEETGSVEPEEKRGRLSKDTSEKAPAQRERSMESARHIEELPTVDKQSEQSHSTIAHPERGRAKYRLVSPTASHTQSGRNDQSRIGIQACREGNEAPTNSGLRSSTLNHFAENHNTSSSSEQHSDVPAVATPESQFSLTRQPPKEPRSLRPPPRGPPLNAPTAPASQRRLVNSCQGKPQTSLTRNSSETGSWSQSKRWISQETKERTLFQKLMHNLHYMGADQSPFIPKTPATLAAFRLAEKEAKSRALTRQLQTKVESLCKRKKEKAEGRRNTALMRIELFGGREMPDGLSPVFASNTCFRKTIPEDKMAHPQWPSLAELKEEGDKRAARYGRFLPLPRVNQIFGRVAVAGDKELYNADGTISWEKKQVKLDGRFVRPVTAEEEGPVDVSAHIGISEVHRPLQILMREIDGIDADDRHEYNEVEKMGAIASSKESGD